MEADVNPKGHPYHSIYIYHDLQFRLDQDEIQKLLMGTALYGDPGLCIRELLQNALDALELRSCVSRCSKRQTRRRARTGRSTYEGAKSCRLTLTWGGDPKTGQEFIRVTDNGVGMTRKVIQEYFTKVGKSYYRSADYRQEQAALANAGYTTSPISLFGIGILSCFMIAERLEVRTCPGEPMTVSASHSTSPFPGPAACSGSNRGRSNIKVPRSPCTSSGDFSSSTMPRTLLNRLRKHFGYPTQTDEDPKTSSEIEEETGSKDQSKTIPIDPAFLAAAHVVWPRYPRGCQATGRKGAGDPDR